MAAKKTSTKQTDHLHGLTSGQTQTDYTPQELAAAVGIPPQTPPRRAGGGNAIGNV